MINHGEEALQAFNRIVRDRYKVYDVADRLNPIDVLGYLNEAVYRYIQERYLSYKTPYENILALQQNYDDISDLVSIDQVMLSQTDITNSVAGTSDSVIVSSGLPDDYLYYVNSASKITRTTVIECIDEWVGNKEISYSGLFNAISGGHNFPIIRNPLVYFSQGINIHIVHDQYTTIDRVNLGYLRKPSAITLDQSDMDVPQHFRYPIVELAARMYVDEGKFRYARKEGES